MGGKELNRVQLEICPLAPTFLIGIAFLLSPFNSIYQQDLPTNSASSSPALVTSEIADPSLSVEKKPFDRVNDHSSVHYQNHTLYQIHHHHYHHMLMADEYHRDQIEHYKPKELSGSGKELLHEHFDYTGGGGVSGSNVAPSSNDSTVGAGHKYHHHHSPLSINTHSHMDEVAEYPAKQRELWVHEGECLIDKLIKGKGETLGTNTLILPLCPTGCGPAEFSNIKSNGETT